MSLRIGVDIGGTNTDAVLVNSADHVVAKAKMPTTLDVVSGIRAALAEVLTPAPQEPVVAAMLGTTQCTNAVVERQGLRSVAIVRLGAPATAAVPPFADWPDDLRQAISGHVARSSGCSRPSIPNTSDEQPRSVPKKRATAIPSPSLR